MPGPGTACLPMQLGMVLATPQGLPMNFTRRSLPAYDWGSIGIEPLFVSVDFGKKANPVSETSAVAAALTGVESQVYGSKPQDRHLNSPVKGLVLEMGSIGTVPPYARYFDPLSHHG